MDLIISEPTKAYIRNASESDLSILRKELSYKNTSAFFQAQKIKNNKWWQRRDPDGWERALKDAQSNINNQLVFRDSGGLYIRPGSISYIENLVHINSITNNIEYPKPKVVPWAKKPAFDPYPYQDETVEALIKAKHGAGELSVGLGKTYIMLLLVKKLGLKTVIAVPSKAIFLEVMKYMEEHLGKNRVGGFGNGKKDIKKDITVAISKSLTMLKKGTKEWDFFQTKQVMVIDESHTYGSNELDKTAHGALAHIPYRFFLSGTVTRGDGGLKLLQSIVGPVVKNLTTKYGIEKGYLNPLSFNIVTVPSINPNFYKKDPIEMKRFHLLRNPHVLDFAAKLANANATVLGESTLILVDEIGQIEELKKRLTIPFAYAHGGGLSVEDRQKTGLANTDIEEEIEKFNSGQVRVLIGTDSISTGCNIFATHHTINLQGGTSEIGTKQGPIGRSVRLLSKSKYAKFHKEKKISKIWDFMILDVSVMENQLKKRIKFYEETGCPVIWR